MSLDDYIYDLKNAERTILEVEINFLKEELIIELGNVFFTCNKCIS